MAKANKIFLGIVIVTLVFLNLPYISTAEESNISVEYLPGDLYEIYYKDIRIARGEGLVSNLEYEETYNDLFMVYDTETSTRFSFSVNLASNYGMSFVDLDLVEMEIGSSALPSQIYQQLIQDYPVYGSQTYIQSTSTNYCGGETEELVLYDSWSHKPGYCKFKGTIWWLDGDGYNGWWIATMELGDEWGWGGGGGDEFQTTYRWYSPDTDTPPPTETKHYVGGHYKWVYPYLWKLGQYNWVNTGVVGFAEDQEQTYGTWGWYDETSRNEQGTREETNYWAMEGEHRVADFIAYDIGDYFEDTQSVSFINVGHVGGDAKVQMIYWFDMDIFGGQVYTWWRETDLYDQS